ncbi:hypothetical protein [Vibrio campbellii]|uniref:hypothetical protein n=1 Tax=Vibrio campbellii TaxID=680 RepID=UPI002F40049D
MAKALKIESGRYLNMDHVVTFSLANETIEVTSTIQAFTSIHIGIKGKTDYADYFVSMALLRNSMELNQETTI